MGFISANVGRLMGSTSTALAGAQALLTGESQGLAFDFTDQSAYIVDTGTPANNYSSTGIVNQGSLVGPSGTLTYTSASNKLTLQSDGVMRYQAHNLATYSEDFTNWTDYGASPIKTATTIEDDDAANYEGVQKAVTTVAGATYKLVFHITKDAVTNRFPEFSIVGSSAAVRTQINTSTGANFDRISTGGSSAVIDGGTYWELTLTYTADTTSTLLYIFPAATAVVGSTQVAATGSIEVTRTHLYRYPANTDYIKTTTAAKYALPLEYSATDGSCLGLLVEEARTNLCLYSNDLTQAGSWTASNMTTAKTATGPDNVANSATTITASAGNATILQAITSASAARVTSVYIKRRTGTGNIDLTQDNGSTWTTQAVDSTWTRFSLSSVTSANPTVGVRIVTSGDAVDVALFSHEVGAFVTSPILTYGAAATRNGDDISIATSAFPWSTAAGTAAMVFTDVGSSASNSGVWGIVGDNDTFMYRNAGTLTTRGFDGTTSFNGASLVIGSQFKRAVAFDATGHQIAENGTATAASGTALVFTSSGLFAIGNRLGIANATGANRIASIKMIPRRQADAELQTETA